MDADAEMAAAPGLLARYANANGRAAGIHRSPIAQHCHDRASATHVALLKRRANSVRRFIASQRAVCDEALKV
jgi:hypothetical protein